MDVNGDSVGFLGDLWVATFIFKQKQLLLWQIIPN